MIHDDVDSRIPVGHGMRVAEAGLQETEMWRVAGVDHVEAFEGDPDEYEERVAAYLDDRLK